MRGFKAPRFIDAAWREAAGPLAANYTRPASVAPRHIGGRRGQFDAHARTGIQKTGLLEALAKLLPDEGIKNLRFRVGNIE